VKALSEAGIPVGVSLAPIIPGINDHAIPDTLKASKDAGARWAWMQLIRLSDPVAQVFTKRMHEALPLRADAVMARIRRSRGGTLNSQEWHTRTRGIDATWSMAEAIFKQWRRKLHIDERPPPPASSPFRRPGQGQQLGLFRPPVER
jgi:DNA repair photolyase